MLKKTLLVVAILIVLFLLVGFFLPADYRASRSIVIAADKARVHEFVGDLKRWDEWTPFKAGDPAMVVTLGEKSTGVGAHQEWKGKEGSGELTFTKCSAEEGIAYDMAFVNGDKRSPAKSWMNYAAAEGGTQVTWGIEGTLDLPVIGGWLVLVMGSSIEAMFDQGLSDLKRKAESKP